MEQWRSLREIIEAFSLPAESSYATARAELLRLLTKIHPDKTSGEFTDENDEALYYKILSAMRAIDALKIKASSLVPYIEQPPSLKIEMRREMRAEEAMLRSQITKSARSKFNRQKIGSAILAGAIAGAMAFSTRLIELPIVSSFLSYTDTHLPLFRPVLGAVFLVGIIAACAVFSAAWSEEHRQKAISESLLTDQGIAELFDSNRFKSKISDRGQFTSSDLVEAIQSHGNVSFYDFPRFLPKTIIKRLPSGWRWRHVRGVFVDDPSLAQRTADLILAKLEARGAVSAGAAGTLTTTYRLSEAARAQLQDSLL